MAPEVFRAEPYTESCDVFSFALVLLEIVSGQDVESWFEDAGVEPRSAAGFHATGKRLDISNELVPSKHSPSEMSALELVQKCWNEDPTARPRMVDCCELLAGGEKLNNASFIVPKDAAGPQTRRKERLEQLESLWDKAAAGLADGAEEDLLQRFSELMERRKKVA